MTFTKRTRIGVIGGRGKTGGQFARLFKKAGFRVRTTDEKTKRLNADLIRSSDLLIFALPLSRAAEIMREELAVASRKDQLILDVSSLKEREVDAMMTAKGEIIGMHPLFGPATDPTGETIILCPARASQKTLAALGTVLKKMKIRTLVMSPVEHDRLMAAVQVVPHLKSLLMADTMRTMKLDLPKILAACTPTYEMEFNVIGRFLDDHPDLYVPIIFRNPQTPAILRSMRDAIDRYLQIAESGDLSAGEERYRRCQDYFRPHLARARRHSEACIRTLLTLKK